MAESLYDIHIWNITVIDCKLSMNKQNECSYDFHFVWRHDNFLPIIDFDNVKHTVSGMLLFFPRQLGLHVVSNKDNSKLLRIW
jgi:hypothetical protein